MSRLTSRSLVRACVVVLLVASPAAAETWYVRTSGDDQNDGASAKAAFRTVDRAAQVMNHGDDMIVGPGTYRVGAMVADRYGTGRATMQIDGDPTGEETGDEPGDVVFEPIDPARPMLHLHRCRSVTVSDITFRGAGAGQGLVVEKCRDLRVERCTFTGLSRGLVSEQSHRLWVVSTVVAKNVIGVFLKGTVTANLAHLSVGGNTSVGVLILNSADGEIMDSLFVANNLNYSADAVSAETWESDHNVLTGATGPWGDVPAVQNPYEWSAASGQERTSVHVAPAFANPGAFSKDGFDLRPAATVSWGGGLPGAEVGMSWGIVPIKDRDGKEFTWRDRRVCVGAYEYPKPKPADGWKLLPVKIEPMERRKYPRQSAGVYQSDGTLLRTLLADATGVDELWWDGRDDLGRLVPSGDYEVRAVNHDARVVDDGSIGDSGAALGAYNPDNNDRVVALPDGGFLTTAVYDEAGFTLRRFSPTGQSVFASALTEGDYWGLAWHGDAKSLNGDVIGGLGKGNAAKIVRLELPGERAVLPNGADFYSLFAAGEKGEAQGLAVRGEEAFVSIRGLNVVRVIDLKTGKKRADWPVENPGDIATDSAGTLWLLSGTNVVSLDAAGKQSKTIATGLKEPAFLAATNDRLAVVDRAHSTVALFDSKSGKPLKSYGGPRKPGPLWQPVGVEVWRDPRGCAFLPDGRLVVTEYSRLRTFWPETGRPGLDMLSNFMETAVVHPTKPEYVYCGLGIFRVDPKTGRWQWVVETPPLQAFVDPARKDSIHDALGSPTEAVVLLGRPYLAYADQQGRLRMLDVSDPLSPRLAMQASPSQKSLGLRPYYICAFSKDGDIVAPTGGPGLAFHRIPFKGLDADGNPKYDFDKPERFGDEKDPLPRGMKGVGALSCDDRTGDVYYLAVTDLHNKMVPGWGADGTGVGRSTPEGKPLWFARSSGGNYMSVSTVHDGRNTWVLAGKSFGGQLDVFNPDGLRITTGNWGWPTNFRIGFVDLRYGVHGYVRPDGKVGAYVEDDAIGRFARARLDGGDTLQRTVTPFLWDAHDMRPDAPAPESSPPAPSPAPSPETVGVATLSTEHPLPKVVGLKVDGDWSTWEKAGVVPQVVALPTSVGFKRTMPDDLLESFRDGTYLAALAHDGKSLYAYVVAADSTERFDATKSDELWKFDGVELWVEEEQFVFSLLNDGKPALHKFRHHNRAGEPWKAGYPLPTADIWGAKLTDLAAHPLGKRLAAITGANYQGKKGYALAVRIPFDEVKLVGGLAGRESKPVAMTGQPGEQVRIALSLNCVFARGRTQDCMIDWPSGRMFSDPTRSAVFRLR